MAKNLNTCTRRQRPRDSQRATDAPQQRRARKTPPQEAPPAPGRVTKAPPAPDIADAPAALSATELSVLEIFRRFRMGSGQMLCLSRADVAALHEPLTQLANNGLLVEESFQGGYSLTPAGFAAMKELA